MMYAYSMFLYYKNGQDEVSGKWGTFMEENFSVIVDRTDIFLVLLSLIMPVYVLIMACKSANNAGRANTE